MQSCSYLNRVFFGFYCIGEGLYSFVEDEGEPSGSATRGISLQNHHQSYVNEQFCHVLNDFSLA